MSDIKLHDSTITANYIIITAKKKEIKNTDTHSKQIKTKKSIQTSKSIVKNKKNIKKNVNDKIR